MASDKGKPDSVDGGTSKDDSVGILADLFTDYLRQKGIKKTRARMEILHCALGFREHFEAEQVLYSLREKGERVGKATIYRTIPLLIDAGILREVRFGTKQSHYKLAHGQPPRDHIICDGCGLIREFNAQSLVPMRTTIARQYGFKVLSHRFQIVGLCEFCAGKQK